MGLFGTGVVFVIIWWMVFLITLPIGVQRNETPEVGHDAGAPKKPHLRLKALVTTAIAIAVTGTLSISIDNGWINFRELVL